MQKKIVFDRENLSKIEYVKQLLAWRKQAAYAEKDDTVKRNCSWRLWLADAIEGEVWVDLSEYGFNKYEVSNFGQVKYDGKLVPQKGSKDGLVLDKEKFKLIYPESTYNFDKNYPVHRLCAIGFLGKKEGDGFEVHHIDNNGYHNHIDNLVLLTRTEHSIVHSNVENNEILLELLLDYVEEINEVLNEELKK